MPVDEYLVEKLTANLRGKVAAAYGRQLAGKQSNELEKLSREFNYPPVSRIKSLEDLPELGIKTFFCSDVCAAYRRDIYEELGGFVRHTIFNEDMIYARHLIDAGYAISYTEKAEVIHSHNYSGIEQLHRNFDLGVSHAQFPEEFSGIRAEAEGRKLVLQTCRYLLKLHKPWLIVKLIWQSGCKYIGYFLGKHYQKFPVWFVKRCSMNHSYWD